MRRTKLRIVQDILSALDLTEINSLGETVEAEQVSAIVDSVYDDLNGDGRTLWPWLREFSALETTTTNHQLGIPSGIMTVRRVWHNNELLQYVTPEWMVQTLLDRVDIGASSTDANGAYTDQDPQYWTSYDDSTITFDGYDGSLVASNITAEMYRMPDEMTSGDDYPDLPERFHKTLYHGALADCFYTLKGDVTGFNIYNNRFRRERVAMKRWGKVVDQDLIRGEKYTYARTSS